MLGLAARVGVGGAVAGTAGAGNIGSNNAGTNSTRPANTDWIHSEANKRQCFTNPGLLRAEND